MLSGFFIFFSFLAKNLTIEEKVGQILMVNFHGDENSLELKSLIEEEKIGNFILYNFSNDLSSQEKVKKLTAEIYQKSRFLPLIACDQEGGIVARLKKGFTSFPSPKAMSFSVDDRGVYEAYKIMASEMKLAGVNFNLAPCCDINSNPLNPVIGIRSFSENKLDVIKCSEQALSGLFDGGVLSCLKHYPGHGDTFIDSHFALARISKSLEEQEALELDVYKILCQKADAVMTSHLINDALDDKNIVTFSKKALGYLRENLKFSGMIVSDSLVMQAALDQAGSIENAAINAINAGCDLIVLGGRQLNFQTELELDLKRIKDIKNAIIEAVLDDKISKKRIDEAFERVMFAKNKILNSVCMSEVSALNSHELSLQIAKKGAIFKRGSLEEFKTLFNSSYQILAKASLKNEVLDRLGCVYFTNMNFDFDENKPCIVITEDAFRDDAQKQVLKKLDQLKILKCHIIAKNTLDEPISSSEIKILLHNPTSISFEALFDFLDEKI